MAAGDFSRACSNVSVLFCYLGIAFKFAEMDYVAKASGRSSAPLSSPATCSAVRCVPSMWEGRVDHQEDTQLLHPELPYPSLPSQLLCQVHNITMHVGVLGSSSGSGVGADKDNDRSTHR
uniref:Uncharacterized protein n=1 Tax=Aegilops tauschii TaxID=37682 RepID=M8BPM1_AEGTA